MKDVLRQKLLEQRSSLSQEEVTEHSLKIKSTLFSLPEYKKAKTVMFYVSFNNEVFTHDMIKETLKDKRVIVPKVKEKNLILCEINAFDELDQKDKFGIPQPSREKEVKKESIDLVIVPGLGFDKEGHRLGYGYAYYDRLLKNVTTPAIGLGFDFQIVEKLPRYDHDVQLHKVITEKRILSFKEQ